MSHARLHVVDRFRLFFCGGAFVQVDSIKKDLEIVKIKVGAEVEGLKKDEAYNNLQVRSELEILDFLTSIPRPSTCGRASWTS